MSRPSRKRQFVGLAVVAAVAVGLALFGRSLPEPAAEPPIAEQCSLGPEARLDSTLGRAEIMIDALLDNRGDGGWAGPFSGTMDAFGDLLVSCLMLEVSTGISAKEAEAWSEPVNRAKAAELCRRVRDDLQRRAPLGDADRLRPAVEVAAINAAMSSAVCGACTEPLPTAATDLEVVRKVLLAGRYTDPVVRLARPTDPAPEGSVVYAVRLPRDRCVVAFAEAGERPIFGGTVGLLPGGTCLTP